MTNNQDNEQVDIRTRIDEVDEDLLVALWNSFCKATGEDDIIHLEAEFNTMHLGKTPLEVARTVLKARRFDLPFRWFMVDKADGITTLHDRDDVEEEIDLDALAEWMEGLDNNKGENKMVNQNSDLVARAAVPWSQSEALRIMAVSMCLEALGDISYIHPSDLVDSLRDRLMGILDERGKGIQEVLETYREARGTSGKCERLLAEMFYRAVKTEMSPWDGGLYISVEGGVVRAHVGEDPLTQKRVEDILRDLCGGYGVIVSARNPLVALTKEGPQKLGDNKGEQQ